MRRLDTLEELARESPEVELDARDLLALIAELREHRAKAPINGGTGAEPFLLGWDLRLRYRYCGGPPTTLAVAGAVLRGYVSCSIAIAKNEPIHNAAALAAWMRGNNDH